MKTFAACLLVPIFSAGFTAGCLTSLIRQPLPPQPVPVWAILLGPLMIIVPNVAAILAYVYVLRRNRTWHFLELSRAAWLTMIIMAYGLGVFIGVSVAMT